MNAGRVMAKEHGADLHAGPFGAVAMRARAAALMPKCDA